MPNFLSVSSVISVVHPFLAFGFSNLAMLGWLGAAAAPILIHLWMRHTHRDTPWAAMEFLREAIKRNARRLKLQQWLLLAVRTLLLLLLALAAAKPYLSGWNLASGGPTVHRVFVIDGSLSMQYEAEGETLFNRAVDLAQQAVEQAPAGDVYSVCLMADPPQVVMAGPVSAARRTAQQISRLKPTFASADLQQTVSVVQDLIDTANSQATRIDSHEVLFFTDLTQTTWQASEEPFADLIDQLAEEARLVIVDVGLKNAANVAVSAPKLIGGLATSVEAVAIECQVANHAETQAKDATLQLLVDDLVVSEQRVTLPPRGQTTVTFEHQFTEPGWRRVAVRLNKDALRADDTAWLAVNVRSRVRVLLVEGQRGAARYLRYALDPGGQSQSTVGESESPIEPVVASEGSLVDTPLDDFDCIFLVDVAQFTTSEHRLLADYTGFGGSLIFFLGERVLPESYNELASSAAARDVRRGGTSGSKFHLVASQSNERSRPSDLLPATIGPVKTSEAYAIDPLSYQHPIAQAFRGRERAGLLSTPITTYYQLTASSDSDVEIALALPNGDPLLITGEYGRGSVAVVATSASLDTRNPATGQPWTLMPAWPSFLPIVRELVAFSTSPSRDSAKHLVGEPIGQSLSSNWSASTLDLVRPDGRVDTLPVERSRMTDQQFADNAEWTYSSTNLPGIYAARPNQAGDQQSPLQRTATHSMTALNLDPRESDLTRFDPALLPKQLEIRATIGSGVEEPTLVSDTSLHRQLLFAVLVLLLLDPLLAWWFGGRTT